MLATLVSRTDDSIPVTLDYSAPTALGPRAPWSGFSRLALFVAAATTHFGLGFLAVTVTKYGPLFSTAVACWFFPFGLAALWVNPRQEWEAAIGNSIFCGYVFAYTFAWWRNRRRKG